MKTGEGRVKPVLLSIVWCFVILVFYTMGGIITQVNQMNEYNSALVNGICIWGSVLFAFIYIWRKKNIREMGFRGIGKNTNASVLFFVPAIVMEIVGFLVGFGDIDANYILVLIFFTLAVGFSEEIYFRSIILHTLSKLGSKKAIIISSILFGVTHMGNFLGGADILYTLIQIVFAFVFGIVFAELFYITKSLIPVITWHFLHDFFCYIQKEPDMKITIVVAGLQTLILIIYAVYLWRKLDNINAKS